MLEKLYEVMFALCSHKLLYFSEFYIVTYSVKKLEYCIWCRDGYGHLSLLTHCKNKLALQFAWKILMSRSEELCH